MNIKEFVRKVVDKLLNRKHLEGKIAENIAISEKMSNAIDLWKALYINEPPWMGGEKNVIPINIPATIAEEIARLVTIEMKSEISGDSIFATFLNTQYQKAIKNLSQKVEVYAAEGGIAMKPYVSDGNILVDFTQAENFLPTSYNSNHEITGAVFVDSKRIGGYLYTRLEHHELKGTTYTVTNKAFRSEQLFDFNNGEMSSARYPLQNPVPLNSVPEWASLSEEPVIINDVQRPLFVYVKVPRANNVDPESPLGASVYSRAIDLIQIVDEQLSEILHEYDTLEAGVFASNNLFKLDKKGNPILPKGGERKFRTVDTNGMTESILKEFAPQIRDDSLFNGLNQYLQKVELLCGLAYGTLSLPQDIERTATEIKASKQRSYSSICNMQKAWDEGLEHLSYSMAVMAILYGLAPYGDYSICNEWGDGVIEDIEVEYQRRWGQVVAGKLKLEKFFSWYYGITEEDALELIPKQPKEPPLEE